MVGIGSLLEKVSQFASATFASLPCTPAVEHQKNNWYLPQVLWPSADYRGPLAEQCTLTE
eukprot:2737802-Amphidinium_carterae.1